MSYADLQASDLQALKDEIEADYRALQSRNLSLNMARGKPAADQLDLSTPLLSVITSPEDCFAEDGTDCRNYGVLKGLPEARRLMAPMLDDDPDNVLIGGNASLILMYDVITWGWEFGVNGSAPWRTYDSVKWICPVPGYDRHFSITEHFGIEMIPVPLGADGPDMDEVERIVASDERVKGIWCVPKYSNPSGITYSDETVRRLASMPCAASDFRIMWDNAYTVHHLYDDAAEQDQLLDIGVACREAGNPDRYVKFASTSKVTLPGAGIAGIATSPTNAEDLTSHLRVCCINGDKMNQLRHVKFLRDAEGIAAHMSKHAAILRPKFELVDRKLTEGLADVGGCTWTKPRGGYFVMFNAPEGTAKRIVALAKEAGVILTGAGSTWPYGNDPHDSDIRIAPSLPPLEELEQALDVLVCCVKLAYLEKLLGA